MVTSTGTTTSPNYFYSSNSTSTWSSSLGPTASGTANFIRGRPHFMGHMDSVSFASAKRRTKKRVQDTYNMMRLNDELFEL